jgi:hypothetical protein
MEKEQQILMFRTSQTVFKVAPTKHQFEDGCTDINEKIDSIREDGKGKGIK